MAYEQRDNQGSLFKNDKKAEPNHADYTGSIMVGGVEYWLNGWVKETKDGKKYFSLSTKPKSGGGSKPATKKQSAPQDEEIPF